MAREKLDISIKIESR